MRVSNCKKYGTEKTYASNPNDSCKVLSTSLISSDEKICSNEYCKYIKSANLK